ncbi:hypothetical protein LCGC14_1532580 [marine sediment metagenome]|uniref:Uncharacterized protein n=1 Tax=marine sediment metagenome TaxID=412755 RepID=A0A0F9LWB5_9ZZZZ
MEEYQKNTVASVRTSSRVLAQLAQFQIEQMEYGQVATTSRSDLIHSCLVYLANAVEDVTPQSFETDEEAEAYLQAVGLSRNSTRSENVAAAVDTAVKDSLEAGARSRSRSRRKVDKKEHHT